MELLIYIGAGAKLDACTQSDDLTPICWACQKYADCTKLLLDSGANPNQIFKDMDLLLKTRLMVAAEYDCADCVKILVEHGADANMTTCTSPLILAASNLSCECSKILLDFGADPNYSDRDRNTALSVAVSYKPKKAQLDFIKLLLKRGASVDKLYEGLYVAFRDPTAMRVQSPDLFELLIEFEGNRPDTREMCRVNAHAMKTNLEWSRLMELTSSPRSLQHFCRLVIRKRMDSNRVKRIPELPVPSPVKQFLMYSYL